MQIQNGLVTDNKGDVYWYENNVPTVKGLVKDEDGNLYFINSGKKAVKNTWYAFNAKNANGLLPAGIYYFGEDGKYTGKTPYNTMATDAEIDAVISEIPTYYAEYCTADTVSAVTSIKDKLEAGKGNFTRTPSRTKR